MYRILLVDDEEYALEGLIHGIHFKQLGFDKVFTAGNTVAAREILLSEPVDLLLCDIEMPGESGLELLKWMKEKGLQVVTIILTCHADFEYSRSALKLGSLDYILKPVAYEEVEEAIGRGLEKIRQIRGEKAHSKEPNPEKRLRISDKAMAYIEEHLDERLFNEQIAGALFLNVDYLNRVFKKETGITLSEYISNRRIEKAKELLLNQPQLSVSEIAFETGFQSFSYFSKIFKKKTGKEPSKYRKDETKHE